MSNQEIRLKWEWPAGRQIEAKVLVKVDDIAKVSKGLLGIGASPSLADALPDPRDVTVSVISGPQALTGRKLTLRLPAMESDKLKVDGHAAFGLIENNAVCVCVAAAPATNSEEEKTWFQQWSCR